jgi:hypothetical protein
MHTGTINDTTWTRPKVPRGARLNEPFGFAAGMLPTTPKDRVARSRTGMRLLQINGMEGSTCSLQSRMQ